MDCVTPFLVVALSLAAIVFVLKIVLDHKEQTPLDKYLDQVDQDLKSKGL